MVRLHDKVFTPYISQQKMQTEVQRIAKKMNEELRDERALFLAVLNGSFMFAADLMRAINFEAELSFIKVASYDGMQSSGEIKQILGLNEPVADRTVVIVEDIVDSGKTVETLEHLLLSKGAKKVLVATALFKPQALKTARQPDYVGFAIENVFVVGYGLDYNGLGRNLNEIHILVE